MTAPIHHEPTDAPDLPIVAVDRDLMETVAHRHGLTIEFSADHAHLALNGIEFVAELTGVRA